MATRRTTLAADADDLGVLEAEARKRGVSLAQVLRELVAREAAALRQRHPARFGIGLSELGAGRASIEDEHTRTRERRQT
jgi:hypothetical protein